MTSESFSAGLELPPLSKGRLTTSHIARWCAAQENWAKIHFDESYAKDVAKLPGTLINGALKQHLLAQFLTEAFGARAWIWRIDYQFTGMDLIGHTLEVRGKVASVKEEADLLFITVELSIVNTDLQQANTKGLAVVILAATDTPLLDALNLPLPKDLRLDESIHRAEGDVPPLIESALGSELESVESQYPLDLSRLRMFAEGIIGLRPVHFDPVAAAGSPYGQPVATPLFPLHGLDFLPGTLPLSEDPAASGREGVAELPRNLAARYGISPAGSLNGGSKIEVHSLLSVGERLAATSQLVGIKHRVGKAGGTMLIFDTINRFREIGGRPVLSERHTSIYRMKQ